MLDQIISPLIIMGICLAVSGIILLVYRKLSVKRATSPDIAAQPQEEPTASEEPRKKKRQISFVTPKETQDYLRSIFGTVVLDPEWQRCGGSNIDLRKLYGDQAQTDENSVNGTEAVEPAETPAFGIKIEYVPILPGESAAPSITFLNSKIEFSNAPTWSICEGEEYIALDPATGQISGIAEGEAKLQAVLTDENGNTMCAFAVIQVIGFREETADEPSTEEGLVTDAPPSEITQSDTSALDTSPLEIPPLEIPPLEASVLNAPTPIIPALEIPAFEAPASNTTEPGTAAVEHPTAETLPPDDFVSVPPADEPPALDNSAPTSATTEPLGSEAPSCIESIPVIPTEGPAPYPHEPDISASSTASDAPSLSEQPSHLPDTPIKAEPKFTLPTFAPEFAPGNTWVRRIDKNAIISITLVDSYTPDGTEKLSWDASAHRVRTLTAYLLADGRSLIIAGNGYGKIYANANACQMFGNFKKLKRIHGLHLLDTSRTSNMNSMFYNDTCLTDLDLSQFITDRVKDMSYMFYCNTALTELDLSSFCTTALQGICFMFYNCVKLRVIYVSSAWDVSAVTNDSAMFSYCQSLEGGSGTTYDPNFVHRSMAVIDDDYLLPGYLTRAYF